MKKVKEKEAAFRKKRKIRIEQERRGVYRFAASSLFSCYPITLHIGARRGGTVP